MKEKDLKRLSRADLLEMLIDQSREVQILRKRLEEAEAALQRREIIIGSSGSIAEASLKLSGIFEAAQEACEQYIDNIRLLNERQDAYYRQFDFEKRSYTSSEKKELICETERQQQPVSNRRTRRRANMVDLAAIRR